MGKVKEIMMDVEEFVYDFYTPEGVMTESPKVIIEKAIEQFGWSFGSYASEYNANYNTVQWMQCD